MSDADNRPQPEGPPPAPPPGWSSPPAYGAPQDPWGQYPQVPQPPGQGSYGHQFFQPPAQAFVAGQHPEGWVPELGVRIASAGSRIGAKAIDIVIFIILQVAVGVTAAFLLLSSSNIQFTTTSTTSSFDPAGNLGFSLAAAAVLLVVDFLYNVVCTALWGGTPGKLMLGLRVIGTDGRRADMNMAFKRWSPILVLAILSNVPVVGFFGALGRFILLIANLVLVLTDERRRSVFDRVAGTYVITVN